MPSDRAANRSLKPAEPEEQTLTKYDNSVRVGSSRTNRVIANDSPDPFAQSAETFKTFSGLSATVKKRATRFEKALEGKNGAASTRRDEKDVLAGYDILGVVPPPYNLGYLNKLYTASPHHFAAIDAKAANIVGLGYNFVESYKTREKMDSFESEKEKKDFQQKLRGMKNAIFEWLEGCNLESEFEETLRAIYIDYEVTGNGYLEVGRNRDGQIGYIGHIPSKTMRIRKDRDGFVQIAGDKATFFKHFGSDTSDPIGGTTTPNEVIHFKRYSPDSTYYGVPVIIAALQAVAGVEFSNRYNLDYFENKAIPRHVVVIKGSQLGRESSDKIVNFFETGLRGENHRTLFIPLPADTSEAKHSFEIKPVEAGIQDSSFGNYFKINMHTVFMVHRTPVGKTGYNDGASLAAARDMDKTFKESVCKPEQSIFEKKLNRVIREKSNAFLLKLNELTLTDEDTQSKIDERHIRNQTRTPNELRTRDGMPALPGGDKVVDFKADKASENKTTATGGRARDRERSANATDSAGEGRNAKGDGRKQG